MSGSRGKLECSPSRVYKKRVEEEHENNGVDIISNLPDRILHHIFTFVDIKQAIIQTCILSRRWRYFWGSLPTLKFTYIRQPRSSRDEFIAFVDRVLMFRGNSNIHEFKIVIGEENICLTETTLNSWILVSVIRNAQEITLDIEFPWKFDFHHCLFSSKSLTKLVVSPNHSSRVGLRLPDSITLPRLKTLSLDFVNFKDECVMNQLLPNCPVLESLTIRSCEFIPDNINVSSPQLQHLVFERCRTKRLGVGLVDTKFQLCAPNLISFRWYNDTSIHCDPKSLSSLVRADITVLRNPSMSKEKKAMYVQFMMNILRELHNVEDLTLSASFLKVITGAPDLFNSQPAKFDNLRCLKLEGIWISIYYIHGISYLLKMSPNIETLSIEEDYYLMEAATNDLLDMLPTQFCNLRCLKMHTFPSRDWINVIACLLKICPNTETLSYRLHYKEARDYFSGNNFYRDEMDSDPTIKRYYREAGLSLECLLNNLKCFELRYVEGRINELEFLEILLKNAIVLEKLLIVFADECNCFKKCHCVIVRKKFSEKVLTFPRASPSVVILFKF